MSEARYWLMTESMISGTTGTIKQGPKNAFALRPTNMIHFRSGKRKYTLGPTNRLEVAIKNSPTYMTTYRGILLQTQPENADPRPKQRPINANVAPTPLSVIPNAASLTARVGSIYKRQIVPIIHATKVVNDPLFLRISR